MVTASEHQSDFCAATARVEFIGWASTLGSVLNVRRRWKDIPQHKATCPRPPKTWTSRTCSRTCPCSGLCFWGKRWGVMQSTYKGVLLSTTPHPVTSLLTIPHLLQCRGVVLPVRKEACITMRLSGLTRLLAALPLLISKTSYVERVVAFEHCSV